MRAPTAVTGLLHFLTEYGMIIIGGDNFGFT